MSLALLLNVEISHYSEWENVDKFLYNSAETFCNIITQKRQSNTAVKSREVIPRRKDT